MQNRTNFLANFFNSVREIVEAAETPFGKLAVFFLPILAPVVPATITGLHLFKLLLEIFTFQSADTFSTVLSTIAAVVLELLGYVGAVSFIKSVFDLVRRKDWEYVIPCALSFVAYSFYLVLMYMVNYQLGKYFQTPEIMNSIVGILSFITVPTSILAANELAKKEGKEEDSQLRQERMAYNLEKYKIKHGNILESSKKVPSENGTFQEGSRKPPDWRKVRPGLSREDLERLARLTPDQMRQYASETGFTYKTVSNYRLRAREELGMKEE